MIKIHDLTVTRRNRTICRVAELNVSEGERIWIQGANGSGKSTLLRVLAGLESNFQGAADLGVPDTECGYLCQAPYLFKGGLTHNLTYGLSGRGLTPQERRIRLEEAIQAFALETLARHDLETVSGGERQRIALARMLAPRPRLLLLDEPFAELDEEFTDATVRILEKDQDATVLIASPGEPVHQWVGRCIRMEDLTNQD